MSDTVFHKEVYEPAEVRQLTPNPHTTPRAIAVLRIFWWFFLLFFFDMVTANGGLQSQCNVGGGGVALRRG